MEKSQPNQQKSPSMFYPIQEREYMISLSKPILLEMGAEL